MARLSKLTPTMHAALVQAIEAGATWRAAADAVGISASTFKRWRARGEAGEAPYAALTHDMMRASARCENELVGAVRAAAADGEWRAALALLERSNADEWGKYDPARVERRVLDVLLGLKAHVSDDAFAELSRALVGDVDPGLMH